MSIHSLLARGGVLIFVLALAGCGSYTLQGHVVRGSYSGVMLVSPDDPRLAGPGIGGVSVTVVRDADRPNREQVAAANSAADGQLTLPIKAFGVGITEEQWLVTAGRAQGDQVAGMLSLPANAKSMRLLVMMTRGELAPRAMPGVSGMPGADGASTATPTFDDEVQRDLKNFGW